MPELSFPVRGAALSFTGAALFSCADVRDTPSDASDWWGAGEDAWVEEAIEYNAFLPQTFDVVGGEDTFEIRATNFGAESYILCEFEGDEFGCEMQNADSQQVVTGWPTYWVYEIDFSGSWVDENTLTGEALVTFPQSNPGDDWTLQVSGLGSPEDCEQKYRLTLTTSN